MNESLSARSANDLVMEAFVNQHHEAAGEDCKRAVLTEHCERYPHLADDFREFASLLLRLEAPAPEPAPAWPTHLPDFYIIRLIGQGGMGRVYKAWQTSLSRFVALKIRRGHGPPEEQHRFLREQRVLARLHHSHIVPVHTAGQVGPWQYFAMAYIDGAPLHQILRTTLAHATAHRDGRTPTVAQFAEQLTQTAKRTTREEPAEAPPSGTTESYEVVPAPAAPPQGPAPAPDEAAAAGPLVLSLDYYRSVAQLLADAADALSHAHASGILHRDVKPANIMVATSGQCCLIDFGLASWKHERAAGPWPECGEPGMLAGLTRGPMGTWEYMAPEQHAGKAEARSDVWGLGAALYEALGLRKGFSGGTRDEVRARVLTAEPPPLRELAAAVPEDLVAICARALRKDPGQRYASAGAMALDLRRWLDGEPTSVRPAGPARRIRLWARKNKGWAAALMLGGLAFLALVGALVWRSEAHAAEADRVAKTAEVKAVAADERAAAERKNARDRQRDAFVQQLIRTRLTTHEEGWRDVAWDLVRRAAAIRRDDDLKDQAAAVLLGLDAHRRKHFDGFAPYLAFDRAGKRLLVGGWKQQPARLWDSTTGDVVTGKQAGSGPVAFGDDGTPLELVLDVRKTPIFLLRNVVTGQPVRELAVELKPGRGTYVPALAPNGAFAAASFLFEDGKQSFLAIWDARSGELVRRIAWVAKALAFSADGQLLAAGDEGGRIAVWSVEHFKPVAQIPSGRLPITSVAFGRNPRLTPKGGEESRWLLAAGDAGGSITVWDLATQKPRAFCNGSHRKVGALAFSADGTLLISASEEQAKLWDVAAARILLSFKVTATALAFAPRGGMIAASGFDMIGRRGSVEVFTLVHGRGMQALRGLSGQVEEIRISPDGRLVAAWTHNLEIGLWEASTGRLRLVLDAPVGAFTDNAGMAFSPDGSRLAFAVSTVRLGKAMMWDTATGKELGSWKLPPGLQNKLAFDTKGRLLHFQVETKDGKVLPHNGVKWETSPRVCRMRDLLGPDPDKVLYEIDTFKRHVYLTALSPDGAAYAVDGLDGAAGEKHTVGVFEGPTGKRLWWYRSADETRAGSVRMDPVGKALAAAPATGGPARTLFDVRSGKPVGTAGLYLVAVSPEGKLWCRYNGYPPFGCTLLRAGDNKTLITFGLDVRSPCAQFSQSGASLAWGNTDGTVVLCDLREVRRHLAELRLEW